ncbi:MAG: regulatory protein RecX [Gammaproteobacteria bacterium]|nr:regulatory protein RecX [Gammaproteobacteria bacterium]
MSKPGNTALRRRAMDWLARREHSRLELARKLAQRFPEAAPELIDGVIAALAEENLQSDQRFAENYLSRRKNQGFGWLHIRANLQARGVGEALIAAIAPPEDEWLEVAQSALGKKLGKKLRGLEAEAGIAPGGPVHQRLSRFLASRGFPPEIARQALRLHLKK